MKAKRMLSLVMAARKAFADWDAALARLPSDGQYAAEIAMVEAEGGYYIFEGVLPEIPIL